MLTGHRGSNKDQQSDDDRACPDDHKPVLVVLLGSLLGSCRELRGLTECVPGRGRGDDPAAFRWLLNRCGASGLLSGSSLKSTFRCGEVNGGPLPRKKLNSRSRSTWSSNSKMSHSETLDSSRCKRS